jgi:hypothetical protein
MPFSVKNNREDLPFYIGFIFLLSLIAVLLFVTYALFYGARKNRKSRNNLMQYFIASFFFWMLGLWLLTLTPFFLDFDARPPRMIFVMFPPAIVIIMLFSLRQSRKFIKNISLVPLTYIHLTRIPIGVILWWLASYSLFPLNLTFYGQNLDILAGISAPFAAIFLIGTHIRKKIGAIVWNVAALMLVLNLVFHTVKATPYFWDPSVSDMPNQAVLYFPFIFLPGVMVPIIIFSHVTSLYQLIFKK